MSKKRGPKPIDINDPNISPLHRMKLLAQRAARETRRERIARAEATFNAQDCQCVFCGAKYRNSFRRPNTRFCPDCLRQGFDQVYGFTHHSNGWDDKPRTHVDIPDGWRGRVMVGARTRSRMGSEAMPMVPKPAPHFTTRNRNRNTKGSTK